MWIAYYWATIDHTVTYFSLLFSEESFNEVNNKMDNDLGDINDKEGKIIHKKEKDSLKIYFNLLIFSMLLQY